MGRRNAAGHRKCTEGEKRLVRRHRTGCPERRRAACEHRWPINSPRSAVAP
jgi:hypothetical protein